MINHILDIIKHIENDFNVKVLFACESGSRAWGVPALQSDFDIRFIYIHHYDWYLSIDSKRDVIEIPKNDSINIPVHQQVDMTGWELTKSLRLLRKSNPPLLEWINSNIVYYNAFETIENMKGMSKPIFSPKVCMFHYLNMARGNFRDCQKDVEVNVKRYLNVLRPLLAAKWIEKYMAFPPIEYQFLIEGLSLDDGFEKQIKQLLNFKMFGVKQNTLNKIEEFNQHIRVELDSLENYVKSLINNEDNHTVLLDRYFREMLKVVWGSF